MISHIIKLLTALLCFLGVCHTTKWFWERCPLIVVPIAITSKTPSLGYVCFESIATSGTKTITLVQKKNGKIELLKQQSVKIDY